MSGAEVAETGFSIACVGFWGGWEAVPGSPAADAMRRFAGWTVATPVPSTKARTSLNLDRWALRIPFDLPCPGRHCLPHKPSIDLPNDSKSFRLKVRCWCYARVREKAKVVTCVYGTRDQWGHWPIVWRISCMAGAALALGHAAGSLVVDGKGIIRREGRTGAAFGRSEGAGRGSREAGIDPGIGTKDQHRKGRINDQDQ